MTDPLRILILEDNPADAELVQFELEDAGLVVTSKVVAAEQDFVCELQEFCPDLILSDYDLPKYNGALALAEAKRRCPDTPFILVTGAVTEDRAIDILTQGAKDYVLKNRLQQRLVPAVRRALTEAEEHKARKRAEEEARAVSLYARGLIEASLDPFVTISPNGKVMDVNKATEEVTGFPRDHIIGTDFADYFTEPEKAREGYKQVFLNGSVKDYPLALRHISGRVTDVLYNAATYTNERGEACGVFAAARDVTERKRAEDDLRKTHRDLEKRVAERTADLQKQIEQREVIEEALLKYNERLELLSYTASRLLATDRPQEIVEELCLKVMKFLDCDTFFNFLVDETAGKLHLNACAGITEEAARAIEWLDYGIAICGCVAKDARRIVAENIPATPDKRTELVKSFGIKAYACYPLMEQNRVMGTLSFGTCSRTTFSANDLAMMKVVTDQVAIAMNRVRTENALRESESILRAFFDSPGQPRGVVEVVDDKMRFVSVNKVTAAAYGLTPERMRGKFVSELEMPLELMQVYLDGCKEALRKSLVSFEVFHRLPDSGRWFVVTGSYLGIGPTGFPRFAFVMLDVTKRKKAEEEIREKAVQLESANKELESFTYSVSHDLRAPLRAIDGYVRMILRKQGEKFDAETTRQFNLVRDYAKTTGQLIDDLLAFSRLGRQEVTRGNLNMEALIQDVWEELRTIHPNREMSLVVGQIPTASGDKTLIRQVYGNLLGNAVKFTQGRNPAVIEVGSIAGDEGTVYYVRDNGIGFDMKFYDKLFGVFQRLHSDEEYEGTGIGLALVQRIINRHGGRIWAEGEIDKGAVFCFTLPTPAE